MFDKTSKLSVRRIPNALYGWISGEACWSSYTSRIETSNFHPTLATIVNLGDEKPTRTLVGMETFLWKRVWGNISCCFMSNSRVPWNTKQQLQQNSPNFLLTWIHFKHVQTLTMLTETMLWFQCFLLSCCLNWPKHSCISMVFETLLVFKAFGQDELKLCLKLFL